jgi:hypothetical protein
MPRSGSTLVEQILASHPRVQALDEFFAFPIVTEDQFPYRLTEPVRFEQLKAEYLRKAKESGWRGWGRFTDKMLTNYLAVGMIALVFPGAAILHTVRNPMDTCLSGFMQFFDLGNEYAFDLADLGKLYCRYRAMMDHWDRVLPGRVIDVSYEDLVAEPETNIRRLLVACGLPWHPRCLAFHETERKITTASADQVRQPIYTRSVERWRNYSQHLTPLIEALGSYAPLEA